MIQRLYLALCFLVLTTASAWAQVVSIPDPQFENVLAPFDSDGMINGQISQADADLVDFIVIQPLLGIAITDLTGLESMNNLIDVDIQGTNLSHLDLSQVSVSGCIKIVNDPSMQLATVGPGIVNLNITNCSGVSQVDLSQASGLESFALQGNNLVTSLDTTGTTSLEFADLAFFPLSNLILDPSMPLDVLAIRDMPLSSVDLSPFSGLSMFGARELPNLVEVDLRPTTLDTRVVLRDNPQLQRAFIDTGNNTALGQVDLRDNPLLTCLVVDDVSFAQTNWANNMPNSPIYLDDASALASASDPCATVGVGDLSLSRSVPWPVPTRGTLHLQDAPPATLLEVYDLHGRRLATGSGSVDLTHLPTGRYLLRAATPSGATRSWIVGRE